MEEEKIHGVSCEELDHIGVAVTNIDEALNIFQILGLQPVHREIIVDQKVETLTIPLGSINIELLQPLSYDSPIARFLNKRGEGLHHIAIRVKNIKETLNKCKDNNISLIDETPRIGVGGSLIAFLNPKSTNGVLIELTQSL